MKRIIDPIPINEPSPQNRRLSWWLENSLVRFVKRVFNNLTEPIRKILSFSLSDFC
jgi:hypothetical protein